MQFLGITAGVSITGGCVIVKCNRTKFLSECEMGSDVGRPITACKGIAIPVQASYRPRGFQDVHIPRFLDNRHIKVVRLSALTSLDPPGNVRGTHFC